MRARPIAVATAAFGLSVAACGSSTTTFRAGPDPADMCPSGQSPVVAAYDRATGSYQWSSCLDGHRLYLAKAASDDTVYVTTPPAPASRREPSYIAYDAATGDQRWIDGRDRYQQEVAGDNDVAVSEPPTVGGVRLTGGQDDPLVAYDADTGDELWRAPGHLPYDDVWAIGDGAVFVTDCCENDHSVVVAHEFASGEIRWQNSTLPGPAWHVYDDRLLSLWFNVAAVDTRSGEVVWQTHYPDPPGGFPRMIGAVANARSVFVSFTSEASAGD